MDGGASQCVGCLIGANSTIKQSSQYVSSPLQIINFFSCVVLFVFARCQGCPEGHYVDKKQCFPCPANTRLNNNHPIGVENCIACGLGTIRYNQSVGLFYSIY